MADLLRISITGAMPSGEEWSVNPVFAVGGDFGVPVTPVQAQTIADAIVAVTIPTALLTMNPSAVTWGNIRVEARSKTGALETQAEGVRATPTPGTGLTAHPFQTALVMSLKSSTPGGSGRGRLYFPATGQSLTATTLRLSTGTNASILAAAKTYLSGIKAAISATLTGVSLVVWSRKLSQLFPVTTLLIGDVLDTQTRRRDTLIEQYATTTAP